MMALNGPFLDVMVIVMLAVVGALVLWLHYKLYALKHAEKEAPPLMILLSESLQKTHRGVFELSRLVRDEGPKLEKEVFTAQQTVQDLNFMLDRAQKLLKRMDDAFEKADAISTPVIAAVKAQEKDILSGNALKTHHVKKKVSPKLAKETERKEVSDSSKRSELEMQKTLERELLLNLDDNKKTDVLPSKLEEAPKRMATPMQGARAYERKLSVTSDSENDLRQALEGRL